MGNVVIGNDLFCCGAGLYLGLQGKIKSSKVSHSAPGVPGGKACVGVGEKKRTGASDHSTINILQPNTRNSAVYTPEKVQK